MHSQDLATRLGFDILLGDVFALVIKEAVRVSAPSNTSHIDLVLLLGL